MRADLLADGDLILENRVAEICCTHSRGRFNFVDSAMSVILVVTCHPSLIPGLSFRANLVLR